MGFRFRLPLILFAWALSATVSVVRAAEEWKLVRTIEGVAVEARPTESGFNVHRGETRVCTDLAALESFVADTSRFQDWIPYTRSARLLDRSPTDVVYYVRTTTPWPLKDRDMVYRISREESDVDGIKLLITGLPDYWPISDKAERIRAATGQWQLTPADSGIRVRYELYVHPGAAPAFVANRRLATVVGQTLANLASQFPCTRS